MKRLLLVALLFFTVAGYAQPEKDALLDSDYKQVIKELGMMRYIDSIGSAYLVKTRNGKHVNLNFYSTYIDTIAGGSPYGFKETVSYLGYEDTKGPATFGEFYNRYTKRNIENLIRLTEKYGYLSSDRLSKYQKLHKADPPLVYAERNRDYAKQLQKLFKKEVKAGNMPAADYEMFKFLTEGNRNISQRDIKQIEKKSGRKAKLQN